MNKYQLPEFLLSEIAIKDNTYNDHRLWVTCSRVLSIVEFVNLDSGDFASNQIEMNFEYNGEEWIGFFSQNNCDIVGVDPKQVLKEAWEYFKTYLVWEDQNINSSQKHNLN